MVREGNNFFENLRSMIRPALLGSWKEKEDLIRKLIRDSQPTQILICILLGIAVGMVIVALNAIVLFLHQNIFALQPGERLSSAASISTYRIMLVPALGGLLLGVFILIGKKMKFREIIDPIEANAIYGGRMSTFNNMRLLLAGLISNASGASIGVEAPYTQVGSGIFSSIGKKFKLRRQDLRTFVAAGSAAAIGAAFNAPLAGAFYGFEIVLGVYTISALSQVSAAALAGALTLRIFVNDDPIFSVLMGNVIIPDWNYPLFVLLGICSAVVGIFTMKSVTKCEQLAKKMPVPEWLHPMLGGILLSVLASFFPQILGSGHGAIDNHLHEQWTLIGLALLLLAKIAGSAISIGSGFKGGLFSSSLLIGCIFGQMAGILSGHMFPETDVQHTNFILVGMASVAASIIGAPITMVMLILEMTGNFSVATGVLAGVLFSSAITRYYFGYSFSTWRFHLRGIRILGGHDIGWVKEIPVGKMMRSGAKTVNANLSISELRKMIPPGSTKRVFVIDKYENYKGVIDVGIMHDAKLDSKADSMIALQLATGENKFLLPQQDIKFALTSFKDFETEELPVLQSESDRKVIGYLTEFYTLRRYTQALEMQNTEKF